MAPGIDAGREARARLRQLDSTETQPATVPAWHRRPEVVAYGVAAAAMVLVVLGPTIVVAVGVAAPVAALWWRRHALVLEDRRRRALLPEALERMAAALRAGSSLPQALRSAGTTTATPLGPELAALAREADRGRPVIEILDRWVAAHDDRNTRLAATALALAAGVGAAPARAIDGVAATLRERQELAAERRALATQARTSAVVLSAAPVGFGLLLGLTDGAAARFLLGTPAGWTCLVVGLSLDAIGAVWMTRLVRTRDL
jgi:tight adherence protein B